MNESRDETLHGLPAPAGTTIRASTTAAASVTGHAAVRASAKDWQRYSSDLLGDRDVRVYRQLPLEADPPRHGVFRDMLQPLFTRAAVAKHEPRFERLARSLIDGLSARGGGDVVADLALPYIVGCLSIAFDRPRDYGEWLSWGPDVWTARAYASRWIEDGSSIPHPYRPIRERERSGAPVHAYLERALEDARAHASGEPEPPLDIWDHVAGLRVDGDPISPEEMLGIGSVLLAGGRDTMTKLITGVVWHLTDNETDRVYLSGHPDAVEPAISELARYLSPLPRIERVTSGDSADEHPNGRSCVLDFASANHDPAVWPDAHRIDIHRARKPHLAFGFGRHSCLGKSLAECEATAFLRALVDPWPGWRLATDPQIDWVTAGTGEQPAQVVGEFRHLPVVAEST